ncbi:MAG: aminoacyl-tRNA hydrolase, partial [Patescibacteria group bacterium]
MNYLVVGLGNPGLEYEKTRHNAGRGAIVGWVKRESGVEWENDTKAKATVARFAVGKHAVVACLPDTFMNKSGSAVAYVAKIRKVKPENAIVVYDDMDLPLGRLKISFSRGSGGHKGVESTMRALKTPDFTRIRIGVAPTTPSGKIKKPSGDDKITKFLLGKMSSGDATALARAQKKAGEALDVLLAEGRPKAMNQFN